MLLSLVRNLKKIALGDSAIPQEFTIGLPEPQSEVTVWLDGIGMPRDVTGHFTTACTAPLLLAIGCPDQEHLYAADLRDATLTFCDYGRRRNVLGEIRLRTYRRISTGRAEVVLFRVRGSRNYCLPRGRLWAHYLMHMYSHWRRSDPPDIRMSLTEERAATVTFIRPHPLGLVSVGNEAEGNIFPMNLMGDLGGGYFGFGLRENRMARCLVERAGSIALSSVALPWCFVAFQLAGNHKRESIDFGQLPFRTKRSKALGIPVPMFAARVRELEVQQAHALGSHRFFISRVISDETYAPGQQANVIHGFYQFRRLKGDRTALGNSLVQDSINKLGPNRIQT